VRYCTIFLVGSRSTQPSMKALGVVIDSRLRWSDHIKAVCTKVCRLLCGLRMVRHKFTEVQAKSLVTAQALSILYYAAPAWLSPHLQGADLRRLESVHYRCLRLIVKDYKQRIKREWIDAATQRLQPRVWGKFAATLLAIKIWQTQMPHRVYEEIFKNTYTIARKPGLLFGYDNSKSRSGRQITKNWLGQALGQIKYPWTDSTLSNDQIRRLLKKTFKWKFHLLKLDLIVLISFYFALFYFSTLLQIFWFLMFSFKYRVRLCLSSCLYNLRLSPETNR